MSKHHRIHILGASGCGTTTLGKALAERLNIKHFDSDDFFWKKTDIPYSEKKPVEERVALLKEAVNSSQDWVISGAMRIWGDFTTPLFTLVVFLWIPEDLRMERLKERELRRYGVKAISPGGWFYDHHLEFMDYAAGYETGGMDMRSHAQHDHWIKTLPCPVLRFEEPKSVDELVNEIVKQL